MAAAIPFLKLGVLLVKQASKPLARYLKSKASTQERFSAVCHSLGQQYHTTTSKLQYMVQGHRVKSVKPLNEQEAIQSGAELISDGFVLSVGVGALIYESRRSAKVAAEKAMQKEQRKQAKALAMEHLNDTIRDLAQYHKQVRIVLEHANQEYLKHHKKPLITELPVLPDSVKNMTKDTFVSPTEAIAAKQVKAEILSEKDHWKDVGKTAGFSVLKTVLMKITSVLTGADDEDDLGDDADDDDDELEDSG